MKPLLVWVGAVSLVAVINAVRAIKLGFFHLAAMQLLPIAFAAGMLVLIRWGGAPRQKTLSPNFLWGAETRLAERGGMSVYVNHPWIPLPGLLWDKVYECRQECSLEWSGFRLRAVSEGKSSVVWQAK